IRMQTARLTNRRDFLRLTAVGTASAFLAAACAPAAAPTPTQPPPPAAPTTAAAAKPTPAAAAVATPAAAGAGAAGATPTPIGHELIDNHVIAGRMEPLDELYASEGWDKVFPKGLIDIASYQGKPWSVPVNIHRANVLWYNKKMFADVGVTAAPTTWDEYFAI